MTGEESIEYFKDMNECTYGNVEPIQMAIKALEKEPCVLKRPLKCHADCGWQENYICQCDSIELGNGGECLMYLESEDE